MDLYRDNILDHYKNPRNFGKLNKPDKSAEENNPLCGDKIAIHLGLATNDQRQKTIKEISFTGEGCAISMASASMLTEKVKNMSITNVQRLKTKDITDMLGIELTPTRLKCALLALEVLQKAIKT